MIISDANQYALLRLAVAFLCGFSIGLERAYRAKAAGLTTHTLIVMGSCLFMLVSEHVASLGINMDVFNSDPGRIAAQVVSGIGFLGAGAIIQHKRGGVSGLTTAAGIWGGAAIGIAIGAGMIFIAIVSTMGFLATLWSFHHVGRFLRIKRFRYMSLDVIIKKEAKVHQIRKVLRDFDLVISNESIDSIIGETHYTSTLYIQGDHEQNITDSLLKIKGVHDVILLFLAID